MNHMRVGLVAVTAVLLGVCALLSACGKLGVSGHIDQMFGNWAQVNLPAGCKPKQISAEEGSGTAVLCEDGRVFH